MLGLVLQAGDVQVSMLIPRAQPLRRNLLLTEICSEACSTRASMSQGEWGWWVQRLRASIQRSQMPGRLTSPNQGSRHLVGQTRV